MFTVLDRLSYLKNEGACIAYLAGEVIFREGELGDTMYVVLDGEVKVTLETMPISQLAPGSILGEMALVDNSPRSATAIAATDCWLLPLDQNRFKALIPAHPEFSIEVMTIMAQRLRRLMDEEVKRQRMEEELNIGRQIQLSLLPRQCPDIPGWEIGALYKAARQVGGDLYDFISVPEHPHQLHLVVADVTGKGVPAALFMAFGRTVLRTATHIENSPAEVLRRTNRTILQDIGYQLFLSTFYATLDTQTGILTYANGGHDWPFWYHAHTQEIEVLMTSGLLLGVFQDIAFVEEKIQLLPGDVLVLYTDGVTEARDQTGDLFGEERLAKVIVEAAACSAQQLAETVVSAVTDFTGAIPQTDDLTLVIVKKLI